MLDLYSIETIRPKNKKHLGKNLEGVRITFILSSRQRLLTQTGL